MKKKLFGTIFIIIIIAVLFISISFLNDSKILKSIKMYDVTRNIKINDLSINVIYKEGNMIDEKISYGNIYTKELEVINNNDTSVTYSISIKETNINNKLTYSLKASKDKDVYTYISKDKEITSDMFIGYNLVIEPKTKLYLAIEFKGVDDAKTTLKGILNVGDNLSEKDLFINVVNKIQNEINGKIKKINEIVIPGYYLVNLNELSSDIYEKYKGYVIIDAEDISDIKFVYYIYNNKYMLNNYIYNNTIDKSSLENKNKEISSLNNETVCQKLTKDKCLSFNKLKYNKHGTKEDFLKEVNRILNIVKETEIMLPSIVVYDIKTDIDEASKVSGYILVNNKEIKEYYLYLNNGIFMISGYNISKNGEIDLNGNTIRTYNQTAFELSSSNKATVCSFSGFKDCVDANGKKI